MIAMIFFFLFSSLMIYAALCDLRAYTLPNHISLILLGTFCAVLLLFQPSWMFIFWHLGVGLGVFLICFALFAFGLFGGGDAKVIAALAFWFGPQNFLTFFVVMTLLGGVLALLLILFRRLPLPERLMAFGPVKGLYDRKEGIPYGVAIAGAAIFEIRNTQIFQLFPSL